MLILTANGTSNKHFTYKTLFLDHCVLFLTPETLFFVLFLSKNSMCRAPGIVSDGEVTADS